MFTMNVPKYLWGDAILTIAFLINRLPSRTLTFKSPLSMLTNKFPHLNMLTNTLPLKTFRCTAFFHIHSQHRTKLDPQAITTIFLGYSPTQEGFSIIVPKQRKCLSSKMSHFLKNPILFTHFTLGGNRDREALVWDWDTTIFPIFEILSQPIAISLPETVATSRIRL